MLTKSIKIMLANIAVLAAILVLSEVGFRTVGYLLSCRTTCSDYYTDLGNRFRHNNIVGISKYHDVLGYAPEPGFSATITQPYWDEIRVSVDENGYRENDNQLSLPIAPSVLTVGDSFTFGDEVHNHQTWPACLERKSNRRVYNGGVFGYGAAQALLRAKLASEETTFEHIVWSILVGRDFQRDKLSVRSNYAVPAVIEIDGKVSYSRPESFPSQRPWYHFLGRSLLALKVIRRVQQNSASVYDGRWTIRHDHAANIAKTIEFSIGEFSKLSANKKWILLQYGPLVFDEFPSYKDEIDLIKAQAKGHGIPVLDSIELFDKKDSAKIWKVHHTVYGNDLVCSFLAREMGF